MKLFPHVSVSAWTKISEEEITLRLRSLTRPERMISSAEDPLVFEGIVTSERFTISEILPDNLYFKPIAKGKVVSEGNKRRIDLWLNYSDAGSLAIALMQIVFGCAFVLALAISVVQRHPNFGIWVTMLLFFVYQSMLSIVFGIQSRRIIRRIFGMLEARSELAAEEVSLPGPRV